ncbi:MAG: hypothetical protein QME32_01480 [Endomicrobiia bacterium]|nr:hypothetical protein [Endomicrobiia bacterium]
MADKTFQNAPSSSENFKLNVNMGGSGATHHQPYTPPQTFSEPYFPLSPTGNYEVNFSDNTARGAEPKSSK